MNKYLILLSLFLAFSCSQKEEEKEEIVPVVEIISLGTSNFGGTLVGNSKDAAIQIKNPTDENIELNLDEQIVDPFFLVSKSANCLNNILPSKKDCTFSIRFSPSVEGEYSLDLKVKNKELKLSGVGLVSGVLQLESTDWDIGNSIAGKIVSKNFKLKNLGDLTVKTPQFALPSYINLGFNECGSFIAPKSECTFSLEAQMTEARSYNDTLTFVSEDGGFVEITVLSEISPASPSGLIRFEDVPNTMSADGEEFLIQTKEITDAFGNIVLDGTNINVNANSNLLILTGNQYTTVNGKIEFRIRTKTIKGNGTISVTSDQANGFISFPITAGEPFGSLSFSTEIPEIPANGLTQTVLSTDTIFDQYSNIVEDGTPIYFEITGDATISAGANPKRYSNITINGKTTVVIQAGRKAEVARLKVFGGPIYNSFNEIVGYRANGEINVKFIPGPASGIIPVNSSLSAIYSDNNPPPDITIPTQTLVTIGPIKDQYNNIVREGSNVTVNIENGFNISGAIPENSFNLETDESGYAFFNLIGDNKRGYINISASSSLANGEHQVWGYRRIQLRYANSSEDVKVYFKHYDSGSLPTPLTSWGKVLKADNSGELDGIYYGYEKVSNTPETSFTPFTEFPFFSWDCFFGSGDDLVGNFCMQQDETYFPLIRYTRTDALRFDAPEGNPSPELVNNTDFNIDSKLDFWGGVVDNPTGAKWSSSNGGMMWIDNRDPIDPDSNDELRRGVSNWINIDPTKKYLIRFVIRDQIGDNNKRFGVVGVIEGDTAFINDPAYELPPPIILKDDYFGVEVEDNIQRLVYTPSGDSNIIKLYFSTRGAGNRAEIKYDNISFKELSTQNIHDSSSTEGVSVAYMKELDTALMFGGNDLIAEDYVCNISDENEGKTFDRVDTFDISNNNIFPSEFRMTTYINSNLRQKIVLKNTKFEYNGSDRVDTYVPISISLNRVYSSLSVQNNNCPSSLRSGTECSFNLIYSPTSTIEGDVVNLKINNNNSTNLTFYTENSAVEDKCYNYSAQSSNRTTLLKRIEDQSVGVLITSYDDSNNFDLGSEPQQMGHSSIVGLDKEIYMFGGYTSGGLGSASDSLMHFNGETLKWNMLSPQGDLDLPEEEQLPSPRYQNGLLYVPELNNLYIMGGLSQNPDESSDWRTNDDFWKLDLDNNSQELVWDRLCEDCNLFPEGIYPSLGNLQSSLEEFPDFPGKYEDYQDAINNMKRTNAFWHSATQKAYIVIPESDVLSIFDPFQEVFSQVNQNDGPYLMRDAFQMTYNEKTGRLYGYKQGDPLLNNSQLWYWDMNRDEKQYLRYQFNLDETAKEFVQELKISIYGYGNSTTYRLDRNYSLDGIEVYLFDHDSLSWTSIGYNEAKNDLEAQTPIEFEIDLPISAKRYVSSEGKLDLLITPRGRPGFNGGEPLMGDDLDPVNVGTDGFNRIEEVKDISSGGNYSCALLLTGEVKCWGRNDYGQLGLGLSTPSIGEAVNEMGDDLSSVNLFDINNSSNSGLVVEKVFSGPFHSCALFNNKRIKCWGRNEYGQLGFSSSNTIVGDGFGEMGDNLPFVDLGNKDGTLGSDFVEVEDVLIGDHHTCAYLKVNLEKDIHKVKCWGRNNYGQLGYGDNTNRGLDPSTMGNNLNYLNFGNVYDNEIGITRKAEVYEVTSGKNHMCANIENDDSQSLNRLMCWGDNSSGQLGIEYGEKRVPSTGVINGNYVLSQRYSTPNLTNLSISDNVNNGSGGTTLTFLVEIKDSSSIDLNTHTFSYGNKTFYRTDFKNQFSSPSGFSRYYDYYYIENNNYKSIPTSTDIKTYEIFNLSAGGDHTCIYYNNNIRNESYCWGRNNYGQLGRGGSDEPLLLDLPVGLEFEFRDVNNTQPLPVIADQSQGVFPFASALFRKMTRFDEALNSRIQFDHLNSHNIADQDFVIEFEIDPILNSKEMPILSKIALSTGVYDNSQINQTGGWIIRINESDKLEFYSEGFGVVAQSVSLDDYYQKIRVVKTLDTSSNSQKIKFYRNITNEWVEITDQSYSYNLDSINLSNDTDAPLVIGSVFDESSVIGPQRTKFFNGYIGYIFMEVGNNAITLEASSIPSNDLLANFVDLGQGLDIKDFSLGENHSCAIFTDDRVKCWGENNFGQTGYNYEYDNVGSNLNDMGENLNFVEIGYNEGEYLPVKKISSGFHHNCALIESDNIVKCWGYNGFGQLGQEDQRSRGRGSPLERGTNKLFVDFVNLEGIF